MKKIIFKILTILAILILLFSINTKVFAWSEIIQDGKSFISQADSSKANIKEKNLQELSGFLYNVLLSAGVVIAVIVATALGIKFVTGGAEGQAKVKEMLIPFVAGCIIVFGGFTIWKLALTIGNQIENTETHGTTGDPTTEYIVENGKKHCGNCGDELSNPEIFRGVCDNCGYSIDGL